MDSENNHTFDMSVKVDWKFQILIDIKEAIKDDENMELKARWDNTLSQNIPWE